jgi:hypothetical protein
MTTAATNPPDPDCWPGDQDTSWDSVDERSWESFPASDPPSWSAHRVIADPTDKLPDVEPRRRARAWIRGVALALGGALTGVALGRLAIRARRAGSWR